MNIKASEKSVIYKSIRGPIWSSEIVDRHYGVYGGKV